MSAFDDLRHGAVWPLRRLGLDPGRALANAQPPPADVQASRAEQLAYIHAAHPPLASEPQTVDHPVPYRHRGLTARAPLA